MKNYINNIPLINIGKMNSGNLAFGLLLILFTTMSSCKKLVDVPLPKNLLSAQSVFADSASVQSALFGIYTQMYNSDFSGQQPYGGAISFLSAMSADEITSNSTFDQFQKNSLPVTDNYVSSLWSESYASIFRVNSIMEGAQASSSLSAAMKNQATGEAKFIRAFCYFYLVNFFGNVPLLTTTSFTTNSTAPNTDVSLVYTQIIADLKDAQNNLPADYTHFGYGNMRTRANKWAATALLARVYLYRGDWANAETEAGKIITNTSLYSMPVLNSAFLATSSEAIWQFATNVLGYTWIAGDFIPYSSAVPPTFIISSGLNSSFEAGDNRKASWTTSTPNGVYPSKYKVRTNNSTEFDVVLRLGEQYLIRAEARAQQNNISGAQADINVIRTRAGLVNTIANDKPSLLLAVEQERRVELFTEWGHRWFDLKRTNRADAVLSALKPGDWQPTDALYPIPNGEISKNPNLTQNPGY